MSDASDPIAPSDAPLTRRELRERERMSPTAVAPLAPVENAELPSTAAVIITSELEVPVLSRVARESSRSTPAPASVVEASTPVSIVEAPVSLSSVASAPRADTAVLDFDQLLGGTPAATTSTEIPFSTRASLRGKRATGAEVSATRSRDRLPASEIPLAPAGATSAASWAEDAKQAPIPSVRRPFVPTTSGRSTTQTAAPKSANKSGVRRLAAKGVSIAAMSFVALMAVATSLPAEALLSSADVEAASYEALQVESEPAQTLDIASGTDTISVQRDGYESKSIAEVAAASGIRLESTFTNNPNGTIQWPFAVGVHIGDHFGYRDCAGCSSDHGGQDFNPGLGAPIQAISDGVVSVAEDGEGSLGVYMIIDHMIDGEPVSSVYAHMVHGSMKFKAGDVVKVGQVIGATGSTGMSTGPHLHFEIRIGGKNGTKVDPLPWLYANVN